MRQAARIPVAAALVLLLVAPVFAGQTAAKPVELTGYIADHWCEKSKPEEPCVDCAMTCSEQDAEVVIYADGKLYRLDDREEAAKHIGHKVLVKGTVDKDDFVTVKSIEKVRTGA